MAALFVLVRRSLEGDSVTTILTQVAFNKYRQTFAPAREPIAEKIANDDEIVLQDVSQGLEAWEDGAGQHEDPPEPTSDQLQGNPRHLWVVREDDVVTSLEYCNFGQSLRTGSVKHTNLTGGAAAYAGGEMIKIDDRTICVVGWSGRYPVRNAEEMNAIATAFHDSGYSVWSMGFDDETMMPNPFVGVRPRLVA